MSYPDEDHNEYAPTEESAQLAKLRVQLIAEFSKGYAVQIEHFVKNLINTNGGSIDAEDVKYAIGGINDILVDLFAREVRHSKDEAQNFYTPIERRHEVTELASTRGQL